MPRGKCWQARGVRYRRPCEPPQCSLLSRTWSRGGPHETASRPRASGRFCGEASACIRVRGYVVVSQVHPSAHDRLSRFHPNQGQAAGRALRGSCEASPRALERAAHREPVLRRRRLVWTYALPVARLATVWDGVISALRVYSVDELRELTSSIESPNYEWEIGEVDLGPAVSVPYLLGWPARAD